MWKWSSRYWVVFGCSCSCRWLARRKHVGKMLDWPRAVGSKVGERVEMGSSR